jgi:hypothetical protein
MKETTKFCYQLTQALPVPGENISFSQTGQVDNTSYNKLFSPNHHINHAFTISIMKFCVSVEGIVNSLMKHGNILWHVNPLLGNNHEISSYTTAIAR